MSINQLSVLILGSIIFFIAIWFIKSTLREGEKALEEISKNNDKSSK